MGKRRKNLRSRWNDLCVGYVASRVPTGWQHEGRVRSQVTELTLLQVASGQVRPSVLGTWSSQEAGHLIPGLHTIPLHLHLGLQNPTSLKSVQNRIKSEVFQNGIGVGVLAGEKGTHPRPDPHPPTQLPRCLLSPWRSPWRCILNACSRL